MSDAERFVRVCRVHGVDLVGDSLDCPKGHRAEQWDTYDRLKGRVVSQCDIEQGEVAMMQQKTVKPPPSGAGAQRADERPGRPPLAPAPRGSQTQTLDRRKFVDGSGLVLFLALRREPKKFDGDPFRIRWRIDTTGKSKNREQGVSSTDLTEATARERFKVAVAGALKDGWKEVPITSGPRALTLKPIPAPRKKAS